MASPRNGFEIPTVHIARSCPIPNKSRPGRAKNWELARYELDEIKEGLDDAVKYYPMFKGAPVSAMLDQYTSTPISDLAQSIEKRDSANFAKAFESLTAACNRCHKAADHGYIVIKRPGTMQYSNQDFDARKK